MKKYLYSLMVVMFTAFSFALTSCGDDDDKDEPEIPNFTNNGSLTINGQIYTYTTMMGSVECDASHDEYSCLCSDDNCDNGFDIVIYNWSSLSSGSTVKDVIVSVSCEGGYSYLSSYIKSGSITIKSISKDTVTLAFNNVEFVEHPYYNENKTFVVAGEITLPLDSFGE